MNACQPQIVEVEVTRVETITEVEVVEVEVEVEANEEPAYDVYEEEADVYEEEEVATVQRSPVLATASPSQAMDNDASEISDAEYGASAAGSNAEESYDSIEPEPEPTRARIQANPPSDNFFEDYGVNPFIDTRDDHLSTFAIDVDTGAYSVMRRYLDDGFLPPQHAVRVEEFVNYFDQDYPLPSDESFAIHLGAAPAPYGENNNYHLMRVGIQGYDVAASERPDGLFIFVIDVSGSMDMENRLGLVKESLHLLTENLRDSDEIGIVVYGSSAQVILEPTPVRNSWDIHRAIDRLQPGGSTNAEHGIMLAYQLADEYAQPGNINRLIVASDGVANVGNTTAEAILRYAQNGIQLSTFGYGMGNYNDILMEQLADQGDGTYAYIDTLEEAERVFDDQLVSTILTIAKDAKIQVEFNPNVVESYRLIGYENRDVADADFRNDTVDAGEIGAGHSVTALYEVRFAEEVNPNEAAVTARLRYQDVYFGNNEIVELSETISQRDVYRTIDEAPATFQLSAVVAEYAELLRDSYWARESNLEDVALDIRRIARSRGLRNDADVQELVDLIDLAADLAN
ncbi:MAG: von Willebrand factor type A domain-containing protein [Chloroflexota bacterium]